MATKRKVLPSSASTPPPPRLKPTAIRTPISRPASPSKLPTKVRNETLSPTFKPRAQSTVKSTPIRSQTPNSAPNTPELRNRSLTTTSESAARYNDARTRQGSVSLHHAVSFSSLQVSTPSSVSESPRFFPFDQSTASDKENPISPTIRIRSKVTGIAKSVSSDYTSNGSSTRTPKSHSRTPSVTSNTSPSSPPIPQFYPITTATPAANPHRFATVRTSPPTSHPPYLPFLRPNGDQFINNAKVNGAKVDPTSIPLPPHSPPTSALSFSSKSSVSQSSASYGGDSAVSSSSTHQELGSQQQLRATLDTLVHYTSINSPDDNWSGDSGQDRDTDAGEDTAERKVKAEAKSIRKIADLEITNRSLLSINASLEATKHRQAKEIRELRRKLRESRLILPPRAYRAVKSSLEPNEVADDEDDGEDDEEDDGDAVEDGDEIYKRIKAVLEGLLANGKRALERSTTEGGAKVLSAEEVRTWQGSSGDISDHETRSSRDDDNIGTPLPRPPSNELGSEDEVETMMLSSYSPLQSPGAPPILVTESV